MIATQIKLIEAGNLAMKWDDGHDGIVSLKSLRDNCPCASCKGETVLLKSYKPVAVPEMPGKYNLKGAEQVGSYALQMFWGDRHSTGLFTWDYLRSLCECPQCRAK